MGFSLKKNFGILLLATLLSKAIGFVREMVIASKFGISEEFDILLTVFVVPNMIVSLLLYAMPHILIPRLDLREKFNFTFLSDFSKHFFWPYIIFLLVILIVYNLFFQIYIHFLSPREINGHIQLMSNLTIIFTFFTFFSGLFNISKAVYNAKEKFTLPAFAPLFIHACVIGSIYYLHDRYGVYAFAYGLLAGSILQTLVFIYDLAKKKLLKAFKFSFKPQKLFIMSYMIIIFIELLGQTYTLVDRFFIAKLPNGHVSSIYYANIVNNLPVTILGLTFGTIFFPRIAFFVQEKNYNGLKRFFTKAIFSSLIVVLPIMLVFLFFGKEIIVLLLQRGAFTKNASIITNGYLQNFAIGLPFIFLHILLAKLCFAMHKEKLLLLSTLLAIFFKVTLSYIFVEKLYYTGISLATSIGFMVNVLIIGLVLYRDNIYFSK